MEGVGRQESGDRSQESVVHERGAHPRGRKMSFPLGSAEQSDDSEASDHSERVG